MSVITIKNRLQYDTGILKIHIFFVKKANKNSKTGLHSWS